MISAARGGAILSAALVIGFILQYAFNVALGWLLTPEQYGVYGVSLAMLMILTLFINSGFPRATAKFLSEDVGEKRKHRVFKCSLLGNFLVAVAVSGIFLVIYSLFLPLEDVYAPLILLIVVIILTSSFKASYLGALQGFFRFKEMGAMQILEILLKLLVGIGLVYLGYGVYGALIGFLAGSILTFVIMVYWLRNFRFWRSKGWAEPRVFAFALPMFLGFLGITLVQNLDILGVKFLTSRQVSNELTGYYQAALIIARIPLFVAGAMVMAVFPFISRNAHQGREAYSKAALKFALLFVFPIAIAVAVVPEAFITLIFPQAYAAGAGALAVVATGMGFLALALVLAGIFQAQGKARIPAEILMIAALVQVILLLVFTPGLGLTGAALATTLACLFSAASLAWKYVSANKMSVELKKAGHLALAYGVVVAALLLLPHGSRLETLSSIVIAGLTYFFALALLRLVNPRDVETLLEALPHGAKAKRFQWFIKQAVEKMNGLL